MSYLPDVIREGSSDGSLRPATEPYERSVVEAAISGACRRIAPLWPLKHFVAVNPFLGFTAQTFHATCATMHRIARVDMLMPRAFYRSELATGNIEDRDLEAARRAAPGDWHAPATLNDLKAALARDVTEKAKHAAIVATVAEVLDSLAAGDRIASGTAFMTDEISKFCAAYFDEGQSIWRLPGRGLRPYAAWRTAMRYDRNPEVMGVVGFRTLVADLSGDPIDAITEVIRRLGVPKRAIADYLHQALLDIGGWAAYARYLVWNDELYGRENDTLIQLLTIRVVWGYTLFAQRTDIAFADAWRRAMEDAALPPLDERLGDDPELCLDLIAHEAYEGAYQRRLLARLERAAAPGAEKAHRRLVRRGVALPRAFAQTHAVGEHLHREAGVAGDELRVGSGLAAVGLELNLRRARSSFRCRDRDALRRRGWNRRSRDGRGRPCRPERRDHRADGEHCGDGQRGGMPTGDRERLDVDRIHGRRSLVRCVPVSVRTTRPQSTRSGVTTR